MGTDRRRRNRILLAGTFLFFFVPIVGAWLLNVFAPDWRPFGTTNYGTLVQPVRPITVAGLRKADGVALDAGYLNGRWTLVHIQVGTCGRDCRDGLARLGQVQQALGDDMHRVQLLVVGDAAGSGPEGATAVVADGGWLAPFSFPDAQPEPGIYLVDPQGYLMMRYPRDAERRGVLNDLERLLKISKIG
jgi:cytochrome oxidase Cu insertion factor (SCO1/SenC/PrrC family)